MIEVQYLKNERVLASLYAGLHAHGIMIGDLQLPSIAQRVHAPVKTKYYSSPMYDISSE